MKPISIFTQDAFLRWAPLIWLPALLAVLLSLAGCGGVPFDRANAGQLANPPLPGVLPISAAPSVPIKRRVKPKAAPEARSDNDIKVWLYASLASQAHLMTLGVDPTTGTRIWENYLRTHQMPFTRVTEAADLTRVVKPGVLILASTVVLSDAEKQAVLAWRHRGGNILSTWMTGTHSPTGESMGYGFMREALDVEVAGNTQNEEDDGFMIAHGDSPIGNTLTAGTRVWLERVPGQLPLRLVGQQEAAQIMNWSRGFTAKTPAGLISYHERKMPSGLDSRTVTVGYPEQNWQRSDPKQLNAISGDIFAWLLRQPRAYLGAWPFPYQSSLLLAVQAAEPVAAAEEAMAQSIADMGGRATFYINGKNAAPAAPVIKKIQAMGHEIGFFGDEFEEFKGQPRAKQAQRMDEMQKRMTAAGIEVPMPASFSAPLDGYDATTYALLAERKFHNYLAFMDASDSSLPFVASKAAPAGQAMVVLPRTLIGPEEALEEDPKAGLDNFLGGLELSTRKGAMSVVRIPSQSLLQADQRKRILDKVKDVRERTWIASAKQIADWTHQREGVVIRFEPHPQGFVLRASVAQTQATQERLTIWINLPSRHGRVRLSPLGNGSAPATVMPVDPWRAAVVWRPAAAGEYAWLVQFEEPPTLALAGASGINSAASR